MAANLYATNQAMAVLKYDIDLAARIAESGENVEKALPLLAVVAIAMAAEGARIGVGGEGSAYTALGKSLGKGIGMLGDTVGIDPLGWSDIKAGEAWADLGTFSGDAVYNEPLMGGLLGSHTVEDPAWYHYVGAGLVGAMQGLSFGGISAAGRGVREVGKKGLSGTGKIVRESGEAAAQRGATAAARDIAEEGTRLLDASNITRRGKLQPWESKGPSVQSELLETTGAKNRGRLPFSRFLPESITGRTTIQSPRSAFKRYAPGRRGRLPQDVETKWLEALKTNDYKTLDELSAAFGPTWKPANASSLAGTLHRNSPLNQHMLTRLTRHKPKGTGRIKVGSTLEDAGAVTRPWYRGTPKKELGRIGRTGRNIDAFIRRPYLGLNQWSMQETGKNLHENLIGAWDDLTFPPTGPQLDPVAGGNLAQHTGYTSVGGGGFDGGMGGQFSGFADNSNMGNIATQSSIGTGHQPIWAGQEWGTKYGAPIATGENMKLGERLLKEAEEKMNEKSGSKKPAHGMVIVIGSKAGPGPSTEGKRDKLDSEKKDD